MKIAKIVELSLSVTGVSDLIAQNGMSTLAFCRIKDVRDLVGDGDRLAAEYLSSLDKLGLVSSRGPEVKDGETESDLTAPEHSALFVF